MTTENNYAAEAAIENTHAGNTTNAGPELKPQHLKFVREMITHGNQRRAYMAAYPGATVHSADTAAGRLMANPTIAGYIAEGIKYMEELNQQVREDILLQKMENLQHSRHILRDVCGQQFSKIYMASHNGGDIRPVKTVEDYHLRVSAQRLDYKLSKDEDKLLAEMSVVPGLCHRYFSKKAEKTQQNSTKLNNPAA